MKKHRVCADESKARDDWKVVEHAARHGLAASAAASRGHAMGTGEELR
jgi:hypothetical protein